VDFPRVAAGLAVQFECFKMLNFKGIGDVFAGF
jgi:hypothetical protein